MIWTEVLYLTMRYGNVVRQAIRTALMAESSAEMVAPAAVTD